MIMILMMMNMIVMTMDLLTGGGIGGEVIMVDME